MTNNIFIRTAFADHDASADRQRFFFSMIDAEAETGPLRAILNWPSLLSNK